MTVKDAMRMIKEGKYELATNLLLQLSNEGSLEAKHHLGSHYYLGIYYKKDIKKANEFWGVACKGGFKASCDNYSVSLSDLKMYNEAEKAYLHSIDTYKSTTSMKNLSKLYSNKKWIGYNSSKSKHWENIYNESSK